MTDSPVDAPEIGWEAAASLRFSRCSVSGCAPGAEMCFVLPNIALTVDDRCLLPLTVFTYLQRWLPPWRGSAQVVPGIAIIVISLKLFLNDKLHKTSVGTRQTGVPFANK